MSAPSSDVDPSVDKHESAPSSNEPFQPQSQSQPQPQLGSQPQQQSQPQQEKQHPQQQEQPSTSQAKDSPDTSHGPYAEIPPPSTAAPMTSTDASSVSPAPLPVTAPETTSPPTTTTETATPTQPKPEAASQAQAPSQPQSQTTLQLQAPQLPSQAQPQPQQQKQQQPPVQSQSPNKRAASAEAPRPKEKRSLLKIPSRRSSKSRSSSSKATKNKRDSNTNKRQSIESDVSVTMSGKSSGSRNGSISSAASMMRKFSNTHHAHGRHGRKGSAVQEQEQAGGDGKRGDKEKTASAGQQGTEQASPSSAQRGGTVQRMPPTAADAGAGAGAQGNNKATSGPRSTARTTGATTTTTKASAAQKRPSKPSRFLAIFACCSSSRVNVDEDRPMPVARHGTNTGKAGNGNGRQPVPATATGGVKEKSTQGDSMDGKEKGDAGDAKAQLSEKPREEVNEKQDASMASGELPDNAEKRDAQSQATSADNDSKAAEKDMSLLEKDKRASEAGQSSLSEGNGVGLGNNAGDNDPASSPAAEAHAIHEAAMAAAVEHSTAIVSTATIPDPNDPARDEDEDVIMRDVNEDPAATGEGEKKSDDEPDDATAMALDEAVTSPTPVIPPSDEVEPVQGETLGQAHGKHHPPPPPPAEDLGQAMTVEPNVSTYPVSEHEDDGDTSSEDIITQHAQQQAPLPPPPPLPPVGVLDTELQQQGQPQQWLLPPLEPHMKSRKCLVLDLDETLVHSSFKVLDKADFTIPVEIEGQYHNIYVIKRPGVDQFMKRVGELYEVVVFTASVSKYGDPLLDQLDIHKVVHHRLFRDSCYNHFGNYVKDLSRVGRDLREIIIIDNSPTSYIFHPQHAIPISSWFSDIHDNELLDLIPVLEDLASSKVRDVSLVLNVAL